MLTGTSEWYLGVGMSSDEVAYVPFRSTPGGVHEQANRPTSSRSAASIGIALMPTVEFVLLLALFTADAQTIGLSTIITVAVLGQVVSLLFAAADQRRLSDLGLVRTTSVFLALICPTVYLFVRGNRAHNETYSGFGPAWLNVLTIVAVTVTFFSLPLMLSTLDTLNSIPGQLK
jgi:hypothetical protein